MTLQTLGAVAPTDLVPARTGLHHAVQLIASAGHNLAAPQADDGHRSLQWEPDHMAFRGVPLEGDFFVRVRAVEMVAELVKLDGAVITELELYDSPLIETLVLLESQMPVPERRRAFTFVQYEPKLPDPGFIARALHLEPLAQRTELALYFAHAHEILSAIAEDESGSTPVRGWPHHFDIATTLHAADPSSIIGVGLSPGDTAYAEPYWYVTVDPAAPEATNTKLPAPWQWHTDGWTGMVLPMSRLLESGKAKSPESRVRSSLLECVSIGKKSTGPA